MWAALLLLMQACAPAPGNDLLEDATWTFRGHRDASFTADGSLMPKVIGNENMLDLCIETRPSVDTSQWQARLHIGGDAAPAESKPPAVRFGSTVCYGVPLGSIKTAGIQEVCGSIEDVYDGRRQDLPCRPIMFEPDTTTFSELWQQRLPALRSGVDHLEMAAQLRDLGDRAEDAGYPLLGVRFDLMAVYFLRQQGTEAALGEAGSLLATLPDWINHPAASESAAIVALERANLAMERDAGPGEAWEHLGHAEAHYSRIADSGILAVANRQAGMLFRIGAEQPARERLGRMLDRSREAGFDNRHLPAAQITLSWLIAQDPSTDHLALDEAEGLLRSALDANSNALGAAERANILMNLAYIEARLGRDPGPLLERSLAEAGEDGLKARRLALWSRLVRSDHLSAAGKPEQALDECRAVADSGEPRLAAWGASCAAALLRRQGDLEAAGSALETALANHERDAARPTDRNMKLGPGRRAEDFYRAARNATELGHPGRAWQILEQLDALTLRDRDGSVCDSATDSDEEQALLDELSRLSVPASPARKRQRAGARQSLMSRLEATIASRSGCGALGTGGEIADYRAFPVENEVILLRRDGERTTLYRRTPLERNALAQRVAEIEKALDRRDVDATEWRRLTEPLARALAPRTDDLGDVTRFALHGALQQVPLAALETDSGEWLATRTTVANVPAHTGSAAQPTGETDRTLFVVNPTGDLAQASRLAGEYRTLFPDADVLEGARASAETVRLALTGARWVHIDAHATYEPSFPDLTRLVLADGWLTAAGLAGLRPSLEFANLSACGSGRYPATADSGHYGLAGSLIKGGASWVIGARADLDETLASEFNGAFYRELALSGDIPAAHTAALHDVMKRHAPSSWGALLLLRGSEPSEAPETGSGRLAYNVAAVPMAGDRR
ncbi:hypothetical protein ABI59_18115 [Acidobacteria bacterium Mor1]|nr:hypothetical protein ABI59_18115 [Acidobacteria bacterium Mor1]